MEDQRNQEFEKYQNGGDFLGKGAFGCVVSPPLRCRRPLYKVPYSVDKRFISKIVEYDPDDEDLLNEIEFGHKILGIDPNQKYFTPIMTACLLEHQKHKNLEYRDSKNNSSGYFSNSSSQATNNSSKKRKKTKCTIYRDEEYMNFISKFGGKEVKSVLYSSDDNRAKNYLGKHYRKVMKHLCQAIYLLHKNNILHKDIKPNNMLMKIHPRRDQANLTLIDFGLSEIFDKTEYTLGNFQYKIGGGTRAYTPPEIVIIISMADVIRKHKHVIPSNFKKLVNDKIDRRYASTAKYFNQHMGLKKNGLSMDDNTKDQDKKYGIKHRLSNDKNLFFSSSDRKDIFMKLVREYNNDKLIANFVKEDGYIYKWDVFSLGLVFVKMVHELGIKDSLCYDLINNMINIDFSKRYTSAQCLAHPFFSKSNALKTTHKREPLKHATGTKSKRTSQISKIKRNKALMKLLVSEPKSKSKSNSRHKSKLKSKSKSKIKSKSKSNSRHKSKLKSKSQSK